MATRDEIDFATIPLAGGKKKAVTFTVKPNHSLVLLNNSVNPEYIENAPEGIDGLVYRDEFIDAFRDALNYSTQPGDKGAAPGVRTNVYGGAMGNFHDWQARLFKEIHGYNAAQSKDQKLFDAYAVAAAVSDMITFESPRPVII